MFYTREEASDYLQEQNALELAEYYYIVELRDPSPSNFAGYTHVAGYFETFREAEEYLALNYAGAGYDILSSSELMDLDNQAAKEEHEREITLLQQREGEAEAPAAAMAGNDAFIEAAQGKNLFTIICILCLTISAFVAVYQVYQAFSQAMPRDCTYYTTNTTYPEGGFYTAYGDACRDANGNWIIQD